jgi:cytochrome aa3-600 menaquinol oxidase subunit I
MLNERIGKWAFWFIAVGFNLTFFPMFFTGLDGQARRMYTYSEASGYGPLNMLSFGGAAIMAIGFAILVYNIYYSTRHSSRNIGSDPWNARTLEWATQTPVQSYNFARTPHVNSVEAYWDHKKKGQPIFKGEIEKIHMPNNSGVPFIMSCIFFVWGFSFIFSMWIPVIITTIAIFACMAHRSFEKDDGYYIPVEKIEATEKDSEVLTDENR